MLGAGYWMNARNGKLISVNEHGYAVMEKPQLFGMTPESIEVITGGAPYNPYDSTKGSARGKLIVAAAKAGWVRIRTNRQGDWSLQLFGTAASAVRTFIKKLGGEMGDHANVQISDFATGFQKVYPYHQLLVAAKGGEFHDAGGGGPAVGSDARAETGDKTIKTDAVPSHLPDEQQRKVLRGRIGQKAGIPDRDVEESLKTKLLRFIRG